MLLWRYGTWYLASNSWVDAAIVINIIKEWILLLGTEFLSDIRSPFDFTNKFTKSILENGKISIACVYGIIYCRWTSNYQHIQTNMKWDSYKNIYHDKRMLKRGTCSVRFNSALIRKEIVTQQHVILLCVWE